jgi:hypothetical protein
MEQNQKILINRFFTGSTSDTTPVPISDLQYENNYYFNNSGESLEIVDFSNVRSFLANGNNQKIVQTYYAFLSSSPLMNSAILIDPNTTQFIPTAEFKSIYYDDERLAESFNNFYNTAISRGLDSKYISNPNIFNASIRNQFLPGTDFVFTAQSVFHNYFYWSSATPSNSAYSPLKLPFTNAVLDVCGKDRNTNIEERIVEIPSDSENYFINVLLTKRFTQTAKIAFDMCPSIIYKTLVSPAVFSQNLNDIARYNDYLNITKEGAPKGIDKTPIKSIEYLQKTVLSAVRNQTATTKTLIQCFVDLNFKTNENEVWGDSHFNLTNALMLGGVEDTEIISELLTETGNSQTISANTTDIQADISLEEQAEENNSEMTDIQEDVSIEDQIEENNSETEISNSFPESTEDQLT